MAITIPSIILILVTCFICSQLGLLCYKGSEARRFGGNSNDSDEEDDVELDVSIQADRRIQEQPSQLRRILRKQWIFNLASCICSLFYLVVCAFAYFSLSGSKYDQEAAKPLSLDPQFTLQLRDWAIKPYIDVKVQPSPCAKPLEPLFIRHWNGTSADEYCN